jgi:hypothetical protein
MNINEKKIMVLVLKMLIKFVEAKHFLLSNFYEDFEDYAATICEIFCEVLKIPEKEAKKMVNADRKMFTRVCVLITSYLMN